MVANVIALLLSDFEEKKALSGSRLALALSVSATIAGM
jgi:hypothetical protein